MAVFAVIFGIAFLTVLTGEISIISEMLEEMGK